MRLPVFKILASYLFLSVLLLQPAVLGPAKGAPPSQFDQFVRTLEPICKSASSKACVSRSWVFVDLDGDQKLSLTELERFHGDLKAWLAWRGENLPQKTRGSLILGSFVITSVGLPKLFASYDADADGYLSRDEAFADIQLDERPIEEVLRDPESLDRKAIAQRLGPINGLLNPIFDN